MIGGDARKPLTAAQRNVLARMAAEIDYALERVEGPDGAVWWQLRRLRTIQVRTSTAIALLSAGYVVKAGSKPRREVYEITPAGRSALRGVVPMTPRRTATEVAVRLIRDRYQSLPEEDRADFRELIDLSLTCPDDEYDDVMRTIHEFVEGPEMEVVAVIRADEPGGDE